jgi:hypothetical protein
MLPRRPSGLLYGPLVWAVSYLGWVPLSGALQPATRHPAPRNMLMLAVHLVWGACLSRGFAELDAASRSIFAAGPLADRPAPSDERRDLRRSAIEERSASGAIPARAQR